MFAQERGGLLIVFVERYDAINGLRASKKTDALDDVVARVVVLHVEDFIYRFSGPVRVAKILNRNQKDAAASALALAQESFAFFVAGETEHCEWVLIGHVTLLFDCPKDGDLATK